MGLIRDAFELWESECNTRFDTLKSNEEELNRILDKVKKNGYDGLTPEEKKRLFDITRK